MKVQSKSRTDNDALRISLLLPDLPAALYFLRVIMLSNHFSFLICSHLKFFTDLVTRDCSADSRSWFGDRTRSSCSPRTDLTSPILSREACSNRICAFISLLVRRNPRLYFGFLPRRNILGTCTASSAGLRPAKAINTTRLRSASSLRDYGTTQLPPPLMSGVLIGSGGSFSPLQVE